VDALALRADEGRGKLRKATGNCKQVLISGCPNGEPTIRHGMVSYGRGTRKLNI